MTRRSLEVIIDIFYFGLMSIILNGFFALFLLSSANKTSAGFLLVGMILWEILRITQYSVAMAALWNIWSRNFSNLFIAPLSMTEFILSQMISSTIKAMLVFIMVSLVSLLIFHFNIFAIGLLNLLLFGINLLMFAWSIGIIVLGTILRFGTKIQALSWSVIWIFQPLSATLYPLKILPPFLQIVAHFFPSTYVFESARSALLFHTTNWLYMAIAFFENIIYFILAVWLFHRMYKHSKKSGQFARNEG